MSLNRKYHNHKLQTNPWHHDEKPHSNHETPGRLTKQSNQLSLPCRDDCKTRMETKHRTITESHNGSNNQQRINNNKAIRLEQTAAKVRKKAKIRTKNTQAPHLSQNTNGKVITSDLDITNAGQEVSLFPAGDHKASINRRARKHSKIKTYIA